MRDVALIVGMLVNGVGLVAGLYWVGVWVGNLNSTVANMRASLDGLSDDFDELKKGLQPRLDDLIRLEQALGTTVDAVRSLQEVVRGAFAERLGRCEQQIAEINTRCAERNHREKNG